MNKQTTPEVSTLLRNKLGALAIRLQQNANSLGAGQASIEYNTLEKVVLESFKVLSTFYKNLEAPGFNPTKIVRDTVPDVETFNNNFLGIQDDLITIFSEFENLEGVILGEFNYITSRINRLNRRLKLVSSLLGDYALFVNRPIKDVIFFSDSFNNTEKIELNSPLLNKEQVEINQEEGIITLPVDRSAQSKIILSETPVINSNSNGIAGNNQEAGTSFNGTISDILDGNADTWFEYERVVANDDGKALMLDFTVNLVDKKIINYIRINPNNFGTRTQVEITTIDTSVDGKTFISIKDDIPLNGFITQDEENLFSLAPSTSKYAGQGIYTFTPREAKYIRISLRQTVPYQITTTDNKKKYRYAIGLRDIEVQAQPYQKEGELISTEFSVGSDEIRKISLTCNQNPIASTTSILASIDHFISPDNGISWYPIRPRESSGASNQSQIIPEILDFNGISSTTIKTDNVISKFRYKATLKRNSEAFTSNASELAQSKDNSTELHSAPITTPFTIKLQNKPIKDTLKLIDPQYGSRGKTDTKYNIATGIGGKLIINLPFAPLVRDFEKDISGTYPTLEDKQPEKIYVDGELWTNGSLSGAVNRYKVNYEEGKLEFGNGTNGNVVKQGSIVSMLLDEETLFPSRGTDHIALLNYPTSNDQKQMEIYIAYPSEYKTQVLKKGSKRHQLSPDIAYDITNNKSYSVSGYKLYINQPSDSTVFTTEESFIDGSVELQHTGDYSIDFTNGMLYTYNPTSSTGDSSISYVYNPRTKLTEEEWSFKDIGGGIANAISIHNSSFITFEADTFSLPSSVKYFNLPHLAIVKGTLSFSTTTSSSPPTNLSQEMEYIDGRTELLALNEVTEEIDPITGGAGTKYIPFKMKIVNDVGYSVSFSDKSIFKVEKTTSGAVITAGDYFIDRSTLPTGQVIFRADGNIDVPGSMKYYYQDPKANLTGRYSVNYQTGEVFTYSSTPSNSLADYEYTNYKARYNIARLISQDDWTFDELSKTITIKDREIMKGQNIPHSSGNSISSGTVNRYYQASYQYIKEQRSSVDKLEPYFTPVLKDYALSVITKGKLVI